jgi:serine/threonine protein kinase
MFLIAKVVKQPLFLWHGICVLLYHLNESDFFEVIMKYEIVRLLGKGGMGEVFLANDLDLGREVALKKLNLADNASFTDEQKEELKLRFIQEAQAAAKLSHPNIITIYEVATDGTHDFIAMEYLKGKSIDDHISIGRQFKIDEIVDMGIQICKGLDYAHANGVVHRDIKPENIFLENESLIKITDFGIARVESGALVKTQFGAFMGTPIYASPEQWNGMKGLDHRTDIYSTGVILYQLVAGKVPFESESFTELAYKISTDQPLPLHLMVPSVPARLEQIILKALSKKPNDRFSSGKEMADALKEVLTSNNKGVAPKLTSGNHPTISFYNSQDALPIINHNPETVMLFGDLNFSSMEWIFEIFTKWDPRHLGSSSIHTILDKLLEIPIYTEPFSGALLIENHILVLIWNGLIVNAINKETNVTGDEVFSNMSPEWEHFVIYSDKTGTQKHLPLLLSSIINRERGIHLDLDSTIIDISGLVAKLAHDHFSGVVEMIFSTGKFYINTVDGEMISLMQSNDFQQDITDLKMGDMTTFFHSRSFTVNVFEAVITPLRESIKRVFKEAFLEIDYTIDSQFHPLALLKRNGKDFHPGARDALKNGFDLDLNMDNFRKIKMGKITINPIDILESDFVNSFFDWSLTDLFFAILSSGNRDSLKYITTWIPLIQKVYINHTMLDNNSNKHSFDMVSEDKNGKVLSITRKGSSGSKEELIKFIEEVTAVKTKLIKTGDIGGAYLVVPGDFTAEALSYYYELTTVKKKLFDKITKYKGFVRLGKNRGFHLVLVTEIDGKFMLKAPVI